MGWYTAKSGSGTKITTSTRVNTASNHTLYAYWRGKPYNVTFDPNGGSGSKQTITEYYGSYYTLPSKNPSKTGYTFNGWYTSTSGGSRRTTSSVMNTAADHTLYAQYSEITYTLHYDANGGNVYPSSKTIKYSDGKLGSLPTPSRTGYNFDGWYTSYSGGSRVYATTSISSDMYIYAHWTKNYYDVTFEAFGGSPVPSSRKVAYGESYGSINNPYKSGYTFKGWYTRSGCSGSRVDSYDTNYTAANHTLYACYEADTIKITFNANGGSINGASSKTVNVPIGAPLASYAPSVTAPCAESFHSWKQSASGGSSMPTYAPSYNATYYATYIGNTNCLDTTNCGSGEVSSRIERMRSNSIAYTETNKNAAGLSDSEKKAILSKLHNCNVTIMSNYCGGNSFAVSGYPDSPGYATDTCPINDGFYIAYVCFSGGLDGRWYYTENKVSNQSQCMKGTRLYEK